jgi:hypothetical protein
MKPEESSSSKRSFPVNLKSALAPSQVGVAVLLNSFVISSDNAERAERSEALAARKVPYTLDPLLASLARAFVDDADLSDRLRRLFQVSSLVAAGDHVTDCGVLMGNRPTAEERTQTSNGQAGTNNNGLLIDG